VLWFVLIGVLGGCFFFLGGVCVFFIFVFFLYLGFWGAPSFHGKKERGEKLIFLERESHASFLAEGDLLEKGETVKEAL